MSSESTPIAVATAGRFEKTAHDSSSAAAVPVNVVTVRRAYIVDRICLQRREAVLARLNGRTRGQNRRQSAGARRPQYLFSGLTKCGLCGAGFIMTGKHRLGCFGARDQGRCDNHLTIRRDEVEARVLSALQDKLLRQDLFEEFCDEFTREMTRLRMEHRAGLSAAEREIERIEARRKKLVESIMEGVPASEVKDELNANAARREELKAKLAAADAPPPLLHPEMAGLYRQKVSALAEALEQSETRTEASEALRGLIDAIVLTPNQGELQIELKGNLAAMLEAAQNAKRSPETGDLSLQVVMVAGAGFEPATFGL